MKDFLGACLMEDAVIRSKKKQIDLLVEELLKENPSSKTIKELFQELQLFYTGERLTDMNTVLHSMGAICLSSQEKGEVTSQ